MNDEFFLEEGIVVSTEKDYAEVSVIQNEKCDDCSAKIFCKPNNNELNILRVENPIGAKVGDNVQIEIRGLSILKASFNLYGIPLILMLIGIFLGTSIFDGNEFSELYSVLFGIGLIAIYFILIFSHQKKIQNQILPKIVFNKRIY